MVSNMPQIRYSRHFPRDHLSGNIKYLRPEVSNVQTQEAFLLNQSYSGVCFQTRELLRPGSRLQLFFAHQAQDGEEAQGEIRLFLATVRWWQELKSAESGFYKVGASFLPNECEWCFQIVPYEQLRLLEQPPMVLCLDCFRELRGLNSGHLKQSLFNHLLGNVI